MVMGEDTVGACGKAFALSEGVCVCVLVEISQCYNQP